MLIESLVIGVAIGVLRGVRLRHLANVSVTGVALLGAVVALRLLGRLAPQFGRFTFPVSLAVLVLFAFKNYRVPGMPLVGLGILANFGASILSGGRMPVALSAISNASPADSQLITHFASKGTLIDRLLGDSIIVGRPYPWPMAISLGDILLTVGVIYLVLSINVAD